MLSARNGQNVDKWECPFLLINRNYTITDGQEHNTPLDAFASEIKVTLRLSNKFLWIGPSQLFSPLPSPQNHCKNKGRAASCRTQRKEKRRSCR